MCSTIVILWCNSVKFALWRVKQFLSYCVRKDRALNCFVQTTKFFCGSGWCNRSSNSLRTGRYGDQIPMRVRFSAPVQTCHVSHPASYLVGTGSFPELKRPGLGVDHPPHLAPRLKNFLFYFINQESGYTLFYKLMGWLWVKLFYVRAWCGPLQRGGLVHHITGQLATVVSVFVRRYLVE